MQTIELVDKQTLTKIKDIPVINEPTIYEEINASYTFSFEANYLAKADFNENVLVKVDGQYFQIAKVIKEHNDSISLTVQCEHVSYELIDEADVTEEYKETAQGMLASVLAGTRFVMGTCMATTPQYYKPSTIEVRQRLIDVANLFMGELVFDNFTVSLVPQRGTNKGLDVELGVNLIGVTEEIDYTENGRRAYEVDLVDLSKIEGYETFEGKALELGDTITIIDNILGIRTNERVLSIEFNPFKPQTPQVTVGAFIHDLIEYFKDEDEEEKKEGIIIKSFLTEFKVGLVDALPIASDESSNIEGWLKGEERYVRASANYTARSIGALKGVFVEIASEYSSYYHYLINTTNGNNKTSSVLLNLKDLSGVDLTQFETPSNENDSFVVFISEKSIEELQVNPSLLESTKHGAVGIEINVGESSGGQFLYKFEVGEKSVLSNCSDEFEQAIAFVKGEQTELIAKGEYLLKELKKEDVTDTSGRFEKFKGLVAELLEEYKDQNYHFFLVDTEILNDGTTSTSVMNWNNASSFNPETWVVPEQKSESFTFIISKHSWSELIADESLFYNTDFVALGVTFKPDIDEDGGLNYFSKFDLADIDLLDEIENQNDVVVNHIINGTPLTTPSKTYKIDEDKVGLFVEKAQGYGGKYLTLLDFRIKDDQTTLVIEPYTSVQWEWTWTNVYDKRGIIIVMSEIPYDQLTLTNIENNFIGSFGVTIVKNGGGDEKDKDKLYLEFGTCSLADEMTLSFKNGPYDEIKSIVTGLTSDSALSYDVTITVKEVMTEDKITSLTAYATDASESATVNFQIVCMKKEVVTDV